MSLLIPFNPSSEDLRAGLIPIMAIRELPRELLHSILRTAIGSQCRRLSKTLKCDQDASQTTLFISRGAPAAIVCRIVGMCPKLSSLSVRGVGSVTDELLAWVLEHCAQLRHIDLRGCTQLGHSSLSRLQSEAFTHELSWLSDGCWRMFESADPRYMSDAAFVLALQVHALRDNSDEGIAACFRLASPANQRATGPMQRFAFMMRAAYSVMLVSPRAKRSPLLELPDLDRSGDEPHLRIVSADDPNLTECLVVVRVPRS